jgi:DNA-binding LytR/AlgR family response regulator
MAHLISDSMPFAMTYSFPTEKFLGFLIFGVSVCTTSWVVTNIYRQRIFREGLVNFRTFRRFICYNLVGCFILYSLLFTALSYPHFNAKHYLTYLLISLAVVVIENLIFLLAVTYKYHSQQPSRQNSFLLAPLASRQVRIDFQDISHAKINDGIVTIYRYQNQPIPTHYSTLDQLQKDLPTHLFYRANRQYIISKEAVQQLAKGINRKLAIRIKGLDSESDVAVSRYKSRDLQRWLQS